MRLTLSPDEPESYDPERPQLGSFQDHLRRDRSPGRYDDSFRGGRRDRDRGRGGGRGRGGREGRDTRERESYFSPEDWALIGEPEQPRFTLALVNIPPVYNHPDQVTEFFAQFGPVERIELNQPKRKAYIVMADQKDAYSAIVNPHPPFNNPLSRLMWADRHQAHLIFQARKILDPAQAPHTDDPAALIEKKKAEKLEKERLAAEKEAQQKEMLEKQADLHKKKIEQQKELLKLLSDKLTTLKDPSRRTELLAEMKRITEKLEAQLKAPPPASLADLEAQLAQKRAEAVALGVLPPARGRGVARGRGRGRGAPAPAFTPGRFTLDNRPSSFLVDNSGGALSSSQLQDAFQSFGGSVQAQDSAFLVSFPNRRAAEAAFAKGPGLLPSASVTWSSSAAAGRETVELELSTGEGEEEAGAPDEKSWKR